MTDRIAEYLEMVAARPRDQLARYVLAKEYFDRGRHAEAVVQFQELVRLKPDWMKCHIHLGQCLLALGRKDEARAALAEALRLARVQHHEGPAADIDALLEGLG